MQNKVLLAISAHPDDIEFSCGGTMFKFAELGYDIYFVVATNGENGFKIDHKPKSLRIKTRHKEQLAAAKLLGVKKVFFLNYRDCLLPNDDALRVKLAGIIKKVKPEIVFTFDPANRSFESVNLLHRDHRAISEASFDAVFAARNRYLLPGEPHSVKQFWFFGPDKPNHFENITKYIDKKISLIEKHNSQFSDHKLMSDWVKTHLSCYTKKYKFSEKIQDSGYYGPVRTGGQKMISVSEEEFTSLMEDALHTIPEPFKEKIENLVFMAEPYPTEADLGRVGLSDKYMLLGIYSGVPYTYRNTYYMNTTPDRIILFQRNIERVCNTMDELKEKVREVLVHEIAHYFGMDEDEVLAAGY